MNELNTIKQDAKQLASSAFSIARTLSVAAVSTVSNNIRSIKEFVKLRPSRDELEELRAELEILRDIVDDLYMDIIDIPLDDDESCVECEPCDEVEAEPVKCKKSPAKKAAKK